MKKIFFLLAAVLCFVNNVNGQEVQDATVNEVVSKNCEGTNDELKECFLTSVQLHLSDYFDLSLLEDLDLPEGLQTSYLMFRVNTEGTIDSVRVRAPHKVIVDEVKKVLLTLSKVTPKKINGVSVDEFYTTRFFFVAKKKLEVSKDTIAMKLAESLPVYPICKGNEKELKHCLNKMIESHFKNYFDTSLPKQIGLLPKNTNIRIFFHVDNNGFVQVDRVKAPHAKIKEEVVRVMELFPKVTSGAKNEIAINAKDSIPFTMSFEPNVNVDSVSPGFKGNESDDVVSMKLVEVSPIFPGCKGDKVSLRKCFSKGVQKHFAKYFDSDLPNILGLSSGKKRVFIGYTINKQGKSTEIKVKAPHKKIKEEVVRVMNLLPLMTPGTQQGKPVNVKCLIPFTLVIGSSTNSGLINTKYKSPFHSSSNVGW